MNASCVSGAASGLGQAIAQRWRDDGRRVVGVDLHSVDIAADLASPGGRAAAIGGVLDRCDGVLDQLVPCAGVGPQHPAERIVAINYFGAVAMLDGLTDALAAGSGRVVLISSNSTTLTPGADGALAAACVSGDEAAALELAAGTHPAVAYAASKVAVARAMRRRAVVLAERGVRINAVAPGPFLTPLLQEGLDDPATGDLIRSLPIPVGRTGEPADIVEAVMWLLSDGARYVHGSMLFVDGGIDASLFPDRFP